MSYFGSAYTRSIYFAGAGGSPPVYTPTLPFEADLFAFLSALNLGASIYPGHVPQEKPLPAIGYFVVSERPYFTIARAAGLTAREYQFDFLASTFLQSIALEELFRSKLNGFRGVMGSTTGVACRMTNCFDLPYEANVDGTDNGTYQRVAEYRISYQRPIPILY